MDLRGLEGIQWRGFSDREIQQLQHRHENIQRVSKAKPDEKAPDHHEDNHHCASNDQQEKSVQKEVNKQTSSPPLDVAKDEPDSVEQSASVNIDPQLKQKLIEEENKRKKAIIEQTLLDRAQQHQLEKQTLLSVKLGLCELEKVVSKDVKILRDKIEETDRFYNSAKKRFERAEAEYIASKMELYKWSEQKELLSNHLCAVIQQNESRKAEKLSELLKSLQLESEKQGTSRQTDC